MANNIAVSITADVADLTAKMAQAKATMADASKSMMAAARAVNAGDDSEQAAAHLLATSDAYAKASNAAKLYATELKDIRKETEAKGLFAPITEGLESMTKAREAAMAFGEAIAAAFALEKIVDWTKEMGEAAEKTAHLAETFGMTVPQVQGLEAAATMTGMSMDTLTRAMGILDKNMANAEGGTGKTAAALKALGISAEAGKSQMALMLEISDKFKEMANGPEKVAIAMDLFGRSGKEMIPFLDRGREGIEEMNAKMAEYSAGVIIASDANHKLQAWLQQSNDKGLALAESTNETGVAMQGVSHVMTDAFAPALKGAADGLNAMVQSFIESYREGGTAKVMLDALVGVLDGLGAIVKVAAQALEPLGTVIRAISDNIDIILPIAAGLATLLAGPYVTAALSAALSTIAMSDAMVGLAASFAVDGIVGVVTAAMQVFTGSIVEAATATWGFTAALLANPLTWVAVACAAAVAGLVWLAEHTRSCADAFAVLKDGVSMALEVIKGDIDVTGIAVMAFGKIAMDALTLNWGAIESDWNAGVNAIVARVKAGTDRIKALADDARSHLDFGQGKVANADMGGAGSDGSKHIHLGGGKHKKAKKDPADKDNSAQTDLEEAKSAAQAREQIAASNAKTVEELAKMSAEEQLAAVAKAEKDGVITKEQALAQKIAIINQEVAAEVAAENAIYEAKVKLIHADEDAEVTALQAKLARLKRGTDEYNNVLNQIQALQQKTNNNLEAMEVEHQNRLKIIDAKGNQDRLKQTEQGTRQQSKYLDKLVNDFSGGIAKMATGQRSFMQEMNSLWTGMLQVVDKVISQMVSQWIMGMLAKEGVTKAADQKDTLRDAWSAARKAYASQANIPVIGPALGAAAAVATFAAVEAMSAAGGDWQVREGLYKLHENEMVLPAWAATPLRNMVQTGALGGTPSAANDGGSSGGDTHNHHWNINALDGPSVKRLLLENRGAVAEALRHHTRMGGR